jgi:signal transduction histidine kinase
MSSTPQLRVHSHWESLDRERARIAVLLHDGVAQSLTGLAFRTQLLRDDLKREAKGDPRLDDVATLMRDVEECVRQVRALSLTLEPSGLLVHGLAAALDELALALPPQSRARLHVRHGAAVLVLPPESARHAFHVTGELVRTALRSPRTKVSVEITLFAGRARIFVDAGAAHAFPPRAELSGELDDRVDALGGECDVAPNGAWAALEFDHI